MNTFWQNIYYKTVKSSSKILLLISINVVVFLAINIPAEIEMLFNRFHTSLISAYADDYFELPTYLPKLLIRFWTPVTYMFMHAGIFHILFNMLWLYWIGQIFEEFLGNKRTIGLYLLGGLTGAVFFVVAYNTFPAFTQTGLVTGSTVVGASASVMAVIVATATLLPDYTIGLLFIGPVKLKWIALFFVITDFLSIVGPNAGGEIAHLGGALFGFVYIKQLQKGNDWITNMGKWFKPRPKLKVVANNREKTTLDIPRQEDVDRILDKISKLGYDKLNKQEKDLLHRASKNER